MLFKYKIECQCGMCNKEHITGYGNIRNVWNAIASRTLRSFPIPIFGNIR